MGKTVGIAQQLRLNPRSYVPDPNRQCLDNNVWPRSSTNTRTGGTHDGSRPSTNDRLISHFPALWMRSPAISAVVKLEDGITNESLGNLLVYAHADWIACDLH